MNKVRLKAHISYRLHREGVLLTWEDGGRFLLKGRPFAEIIPLLDGDRTVDEIVELIADRVTAPHAYYAFQHLEKQQFLTFGAVPESPADAFWEHCLMNHPAACLPSESLKISVISVSEDVSLVRLLCDAVEAMGYTLSTVSDADCSILLVRDYLEQGVAARIHELTSASKRCIPVKLRGVESWFGPVLGPGTSCWTCLSRRLLENRPQEIGFSVVRVDAAKPGFLSATACAGASLAITSITHWLTGTSVELERRVITLDHRKTMIKRHDVSRLSDCPECGVASPAEHWTVDFKLAKQKKTFISDGGHRICSPEETYRRLLPLTSPITGVIPDLERVELGARLIVYQTKQNTPLESHSFYSTNVSRRDGAAGKGMSDIQAKVSCLAEAIERYSCVYRGTEVRKRAPYYDMGVDAIEPNQLLEFSTGQYESRQGWNMSNPGFNWVPEMFDPSLPIEWSPAWSLTNRQVKWLPTAYCYFAYPFVEGPQFCKGDSNGCASGNTLEEAILQGYLELVERDAMAIFWYNRIRRPRIDGRLDPVVASFIESYSLLGRHLELINITHDLGVTVILAVSWNEHGREILMGLGAHLDSRIAISRALSELNQMLPVATAWADADSAQRPNPIDDEHISEWMNGATIANQPYLMPLENETIRLEELPTIFHECLSEDIEWCVERLRCKGLEMIVLDLTRPDVNFPTVRVTVPGLRHFWARFGAGRLYNVPRELGWIPKPLNESDLNPIPLFL